MCVLGPVPPHALYMMDNMVTDQRTGERFVDYFSQSIQHDPKYV